MKKVDNFGSGKMTGEAGCVIGHNGHKFKQVNSGWKKGNQPSGGHNWLSFPTDTLLSILYLYKINVSIMFTKKLHWKNNIISFNEAN